MATGSEGKLDRSARQVLVGLRRRRAERLPEPAECRAIRASAGIAVEELAAAIGVSPDAIYTWETGVRNPGRKSRDRYAEALRLLRAEAE